MEYEFEENEMSREQRSLEARLEVYLCPISLEIMKNPYITKYGHCFEKRIIERWIIENETCPLTKGPLTLEDISPCHALRSIIETDIEIYGLSYMKAILPVSNRGKIVINENIKNYVEEVSGMELRRMDDCNDYSPLTTFLVFPPSSEFLGFKSTGSITLENFGDTTIKLVSWNRTTQERVGEFDLRPMTTKGFDFKGNFCIEIEEGDASKLRVIDFTTKGGGKGDDLGMATN